MCNSGSAKLQNNSILQARFFAAKPSRLKATTNLIIVFKLEKHSAFLSRQKRMISKKMALLGKASRRRAAYSGSPDALFLIFRKIKKTLKFY